MRYTQEQMEATIVEWQNSGLSKTAFCREREIAYHTFHYWCKRVLSPVSSGFDELKVAHGAPGTTFELNFPSGARMTFEGQPSAAWLRELLQ